MGCLFARRVPARKLKVAIAIIAIFAGLQLVWNGARTLAARGDHATKIIAPVTTAARTP